MPSRQTRQLFFLNVYPLLILCTFLAFFRAHWAFQGTGFDESCYLEYLHTFIGLPYPRCYSHSHFPGISVLWIPAGLLSRAIAWASGNPVDTWLLPLTGLESFFFWALSLYLCALIWLEYRPKLRYFARSWIWPVVFLFSVPVLAHAVGANHLPHSGELAVALLATVFLVSRRFLLASVAIAFVTLTHLNDAPMILMLLGALIDSAGGRGELDRKRLALLLWVVGIVTAVVAAIVLWIGFFVGYHGIMLMDIVRNITPAGVLRVVFTKHLGMLWFTPHWLLIFAIGIWRFRKLSWMARGALLWCAADFAFHVGHAIWWGQQPQQIRYLVGTYAGLIVLTLELVPQLSLSLRRVSHAIMIAGAGMLCLYNWFGADSNTAGMLVDGSIWSNSIQYKAADGSELPQFLRKGVIEPLASSPMGFSAYSWLRDDPHLARYKGFSRYALAGPPLWILSLLAALSCLLVTVLGRRVAVVFWRLALQSPPRYLDYRLDRNTTIAPPFHYPIDFQKIAALRARKQQAGPKFPKIGILVVSHQSSRCLVETLNRIPRELVSLVNEVFIFDDFSQDGTYELAKELSRAPDWKDKIKVHRNVRHLGYGGNQKVGFRYAIEKGMDYVVLLHDDGKYAPEFLPDLIYEAVLGGKNVVFGSRMMDKWSALRSGMPLHKWFANRLLTHFENLTLGLSLTEFHSGYRLYATSVLKNLPLEANTDDFHFDTQIIVQCRALGEEPAEIPIPTYSSHEISGVGGLRYAWNVGATVVSYRLHQIRIVHDNRFDVTRDIKYQLKSSPYSSHGQILRLVREGSTVLDIGCGGGLLARKLSEKGAKVDGIDVREKADVWEGLESYQQMDLENLKDLKYQRRFDHILMADVLEHIRNPSEWLRRVRPLLKPEGTLIASTGNVALWYMRLSLLLGRFNYGERGILDRTHVHLYTKQTFLRKIVDTGYRVKSVRQTSLPFEVVFQSTGKSRVMKGIDWLYYGLARIAPSLFAYQFVVEADILGLESAQGEGEIRLHSENE